MSKPAFFKTPRPLADGSQPPAPLTAAATRVVRFNEVDPLKVLWHGHYASYFEDARVAFGNRYGLSYQAIHAAGYATPIKQMHVEYDAPLLFGQECRILATLYWNDAARLNFAYAIQDAATAQTVTRGYTVQLFLSLSGEVQYAKSDFYEAFCAQWQQGDFDLRP